MYTPEQLALIMEDESLKAAYKEMLLMDLRVRSADLQSKYNSMVVREEEARKPKDLPPEIF